MKDNVYIGKGARVRLVAAVGSLSYFADELDKLLDGDFHYIDEESLEELITAARNELLLMADIVRQEHAKRSEALMNGYPENLEEPKTFGLYGGQDK